MSKAKPLGRNTFRVDISIDISDIQINERDFSFNYKVWINDSLVTIQNSYTSEHSHSTEEAKEVFRILLEDGFAHRLVMEEHIIDQNLWK